MKNSFRIIMIGGVILAIIFITLDFLEFSFAAGYITTANYTGIIAIIFALLGIYMGYSILSKEKMSQPDTPKIDTERLAQLNLKEREYEILKLIAQGYSNQEIANHLFLAIPTIKTHTSNLYTKLEVKSRTQAIFKAQSWKLI